MRTIKATLVTWVFIASGLAASAQQSAADWQSKLNA